MDIQKYIAPEAYSNTKEYNAGDVVLYKGGVFVALCNIINATPDNESFWKLFTVYTKMKPWIINDLPKIYLLKNSTLDIIVNGFYLEDTLIPSIEHCTINSVAVVSPNEMIINVSTDDINVNDIELTWNRETVGDSIIFDIIDSIMGDGPAGTFTTDFDNFKNGEWPNWDLNVYGNIKKNADFFKTGTNTPSTNTGAKATTPGYTNKFGYCETSNPNNGAGQYATAETSYFNILDSIQFKYHMYGSGMGDLILESHNTDGTWTERLKLSGQQQTSQISDFIDTGVIDASSWATDKIRITFKNMQNYMSDFCLEDIVIKSH